VLEIVPRCSCKTIADQLLSSTIPGCSVLVEPWRLAKMKAIGRVAAIIAVSSLLVAGSSPAWAQSYNGYGLNQQMSPPYTTYSPVFPTYQPAPTIGGFQQTYTPPVYNPPPVPQPSYPQYLAPGASCIGRIGMGC
jgi:hypothetical protein